MALTANEILSRARAAITLFVEEKTDNDETNFSFEEAEAVAEESGIHVSSVVQAVKGYGLTMMERPVEKRVRGFRTSSNDRFFGPGSSPMHGGSGAEQINGFAGQKG